MLPTKVIEKSIKGNNFLYAVVVTIPSNEETSVSETDLQPKAIKQEGTPDAQPQQTNEETQEQSVNTFAEVNTTEANQLATEVSNRKLKQK